MFTVTTPTDNAGMVNCKVAPFTPTCAAAGLIASGSSSEFRAPSLPGAITCIVADLTYIAQQN